MTKHLALPLSPQRPRQDVRDGALQGPQGGNLACTVTSMTESASIYVVDDDERVRVALVALLEAHGWRVLAYDSLQPYLAAPHGQGPACLILDVILPDSNGVDFLTLIQASQHPPIILITGQGDIPSSVRAMRQGAIDYLTKPFSEADLLRSVDAALSEDLARRHVQSQLAELTRRSERLTPREREVMRFVVSGYLNKQAAVSLGISEVTLQAHRSSVMRKMGATSLAQLVRIADRLAVPPVQAPLARKGA